MNPNTGEIHFFDNNKDREKLESELKHKLFGLSQEDLEEVVNMPMRKRKAWMRNQPCDCGSGKKYKKCCLLK